jgi:hypothetical protein
MNKKDQLSPRFLTFALIAMLLLSSIGAVLAADQGEEGLQITEISAYKPGFLGKPLAIVLDKAVFSQGETTNIIVGSNVPCNTKKSVLEIKKVGGSSLYTKDITSVISPCATSYVKIGIVAPSTAGDYQIGVTFYDGVGAKLFEDKTFFRVSSPTQPAACPQNYCSDWTTVQRFEFGLLQNKVCYTYDAASACRQSQQQFTRTVCDDGFELKSGACVKPSGEAVCGDRVKQTGEECDLGDDNGVCPSSCNLACRTSNCQTLPGNGEPSDDTEKDDGGEDTDNTALYVLIGAAVLGAGLYTGVIPSGKKG